MTAIRSDSGFIIEPDVQPILDVDEEASIASDESIGMFVYNFMVWKDKYLNKYGTTKMCALECGINVPARLLIFKFFSRGHALISHCFFYS